VVVEGAIFGCLACVALLAALGSSDLLARVRSTVASRFSPTSAERVTQIAFAVLAVLVVVSAVTLNRSIPAREVLPLADRYASAVLAELPPGSVLFVWNSERAQPLTYQQVVFGRRSDVTVIDTEALTSAWYREQASRRLGLSVPSTRQSLPSLAASVATVADALAKHRPVYLDINAAHALHQALSYRPIGLVAQYVPKGGSAAVVSPPELGAHVQHDITVAGIRDPAWSAWPNITVRDSYLAALFEVAKDYLAGGDVAAAERTYRIVLQVDPGNRQAKDNLTKVLSGELNQ
jgi:hypothetical protein